MNEQVNVKERERERDSFTCWPQNEWIEIEQRFIVYTCTPDDDREINAKLRDRKGF